MLYDASQRELAYVESVYGRTDAPGREDWSNAEIVVGSPRPTPTREHAHCGANSWNHGQSVGAWVTGRQAIALMLYAMAVEDWFKGLLMICSGSGPLPEEEAFREKAAAAIAKQLPKDTASLEIGIERRFREYMARNLEALDEPEVAELYVAWMLAIAAQNRTIWCQVPKNHDLEALAEKLDEASKRVGASFYGVAKKHGLDQSALKQFLSDLQRYIFAGRYHVPKEAGKTLTLDPQTNEPIAWGQVRPFREQMNKLNETLGSFCTQLTSPRPIRCDIEGVVGASNLEAETLGQPSSGPDADLL